MHLPALRLEAHLHILRLRVLGHLVESDAVGVVHEDEVVQLLVASKSHRLIGHTLLQAAVAMPTPLPTPWPSGPVVDSTPGVQPNSGWPGVFESLTRKLATSSIGRS